MSKNAAGVLKTKPSVLPIIGIGHTDHGFPGQA